jgi:hypothetical protein
LVNVVLPSWVVTKNDVALAGTPEYIIILVATVIAPIVRESTKNDGFLNALMTCFLYLIFMVYLLFLENSGICFDITKSYFTIYCFDVFGKPFMNFLSMQGRKWKPNQD